MNVSVALTAVWTFGPTHARMTAGITPIIPATTLSMFIAFFLPSDDNVGRYPSKEEEEPAVVQLHGCSVYERES